MASLEDLTTDQLLEVARLQEKLASNPETRADYMRLVKKTNPSLAIPEIDMADKMEQRLAKESEARQNLEQKLAQKEAEERVARKRDKVKTDFKLSDDQLTQVEKLMTDKRIPDYETAAEFFQMSQRAAPPTPSTFMRPNVDMPDSAVWGRGLNNKAALDKIARDEAYKAWGELATFNDNGGLGRAS